MEDPVVEVVELPERGRGRVVLDSAGGAGVLLFTGDWRMMEERLCSVMRYS